jgi:SAM-dependent methyltransferase
MALKSVKQALLQVPGVSDVQKRLDRKSLRARREDEDPGSRSKERWRRSRPDAGLTWGRELSGAAFVRKAAEYGAFGPDHVVLEVGPGYGRLVRAALDEEVAFKRWVGLDLSAGTVESFNERFHEDPVEAVLGDAETARLGPEFDVLLSSLTFKHIYPTFGRALSNLQDQLRPGGLAIFDLIEGEREYFQRQDGVTYIRHYSRDEAADLVSQAAMKLVTFDAVDHDDDPAHRRLLVVARRPS